MNTVRLPRICLIRHGETEWSRSGQHTGNTDLPLTEAGEAQARRLGELLRRFTFNAILTSPRQRAQRTCDLAGLTAQAQVAPDLREWDYGDYEGLTTAEIRKQQPGWDVFQNGCPHGETPAQMSERADRVVAHLRSLEGLVALFSHGHFLRALAVRWVGLPIGEGQHLGLNTATLSLLGYLHNEASTPAILMWNASSAAHFELPS